MGKIKTLKEEGISLKRINIAVLVCSLVITMVLLFSVLYTFKAYFSYSEAADKFIDLQETADSLMEASDYLTEEARMYTVTGDREHLDNYFHEALIDRRRDKAIAAMESDLPGSQALNDLKEAMNKSVSLMNREYHAMHLTSIAVSETQLPDQIKEDVLSPEEEQMSSEQKLQRAQYLMHDQEYNDHKEKIYSNLMDCVSSLKSESISLQGVMRRQLLISIMWMSILILLQSGELVIIFVLTSRLGINPLVNAVDYIEQNEKIPVAGSREFRYLATTFNGLYSVYNRNMKKLSFKAYHDELTGLYNRAGFDLIMHSLDAENTAFLLIDSDKFKDINDQNGHDTGDRVLRKVADTLKSNFRPADYVFRIGGDEFVVLMTQVTTDLRKMIKDKVDMINRTLSDDSDGLPLVSVSVGVAICTEDMDFHEMYKNADEALYEVKQNGRCGCAFYNSDSKE